LHFAELLQSLHEAARDAVHKSSAWLRDLWSGAVCRRR
jgi:hypothetical protein